MLRRRSRTSPRIQRAWALILFVVVTAAAAIYLLSSVSEDPLAGQAPAEALWGTARSVVIDESFSAIIEVVFSESETVPAARVGGVVTNTALEAGTTMTSGTVVYEVDSRPVFALVADVPPFRVPREGVSGQDITGLADLLVNLGHLDMSVTTVDRDFLEAARAFVNDLGYAEGTDAPSSLMDHVVWIGDRDSDFGEYSDIKEGGPAPIYPAAVLAKRRSITSASVTPVPDDALGTRAWVFETDALSLPVNADGTVSTGLESVQLALGDTSTLAGTVRLLNPEPVWVVPASALISSSAGDRHCLVIRDGDQERVERVIPTGASVPGVSLRTNIDGREILLNAFSVIGDDLIQQCS